MRIKYHLYRAQFRMAPYLPLSFPTHVDLELAGKCQLACTMCNYGIGTFDESMQGMMSRDMAFEALRQAAEGGARSLKLNFRGEPGLCMWLTDVAREAKYLGFVEVMINTNLTAFSLRRVRELVGSGLDKIIVSIDGATQATYEMIRVNGDWNKLKMRMAELSAYRGPNRRPPAVYIQFVVQDANRHEVGLIRDVFGTTCDGIIIQDVQNRGQGEGLDSGARKRCPQPWQRLIVAWDGTIFPCCSNWNNEWPLGNIKHMTLQEAWEGERMRELRERAAKPASGSPCDRCTVKASYR